MLIAFSRLGHPGDSYTRSRGSALIETYLERCRHLTVASDIGSSMIDVALEEIDTVWRGVPLLVDRRAGATERGWENHGSCIRGRDTAARG